MTLLQHSSSDLQTLQESLGTGGTESSPQGLWIQGRLWSWEELGGLHEVMTAEDLSGFLWGP